MPVIKPLARQNEIVVQEMGDEILIYNLKTNKAFSLNQTSSAVWQLSDGNRTISDIASLLSDKFSSTITEDFVWLAIAQLKKDDLIESNSEISTFLGGMNRREVISKVGFATMIALPVISTLVAPLAVNAASVTCPGSGLPGNPLSCPCSANGNCLSGCCGTNGTTATCVTVALDPTGAACRAGCECFSNCCVGGLCHFGEIPSGSGTYTTACQCASNRCNTTTGICN